MSKIILAGVLTWLWPQVVSAHSFGVLYNLPVPFWMYLYGGVAAILVSFLIIGYFFNKVVPDFSYPTLNLSRFNFFASLTNPRFLGTLKVVSIFLFVLTILSGLFEKSAYASFSMTFFWIIFVLGFTYATALIGNIYAIVNPWKVSVEWLMDKEVEGLIRYPKSLGYYPALIFYFIFIWFELVGQTSPNKLAVILIIYTILNYFGVIAFGKEIWFRYCEFFSVFFRLIGKIAPIEYRDGKLYLRPPFIGLLKESAEYFSLLLFTLFMLSSTAFDGFKETLPWVRFYWQNLDKVLRPVFGSNSYAMAKTGALLLSPFIFLSLYFLLVALAKVIAKSMTPLKTLLLQFTFSLIPIAFVYNIAHYYTLVLTEGPKIFRLNSFILSANFVWHSQVAFILLGHIAGVYLSHMIALKNFSSSHKRIILSQFPMLVLMVVYTVAGLWILSQPITGGTL